MEKPSQAVEKTSTRIGKPSIAVGERSIAVGKISTAVEELSIAIEKPSTAFMAFSPAAPNLFYPFLKNGNTSIVTPAGRVKMPDADSGFQDVSGGFGGVSGVLFSRQSRLAKKLVLYSLVTTISGSLCGKCRYTYRLLTTRFR